MTETEAILLDTLKKYETDLMDMLVVLERERKAAEQNRKETENEIISVLQNFGERLNNLETNYSTLQNQIVRVSEALKQQSEILTRLTKA